MVGYILMSGAGLARCLDDLWPELQMARCNAKDVKVEYISADSEESGLGTLEHSVMTSFRSQMPSHPVR